MSQAEQPHFSERTLNLAETSQRLLGSLGQPLVRAISGSSSPAYIQLEWSKQDQLNIDDYTWVGVPGDPQAGKIPRNWRRAAVLGTQWGALSKLYDKIDEPVHAMEALAFVADDSIRVGVKENGYSLFRSLLRPNENGKYAAVAMRLGRGPLQATMGLWLPEKEQLLAADDIEVITPSTSVRQLSSQYPRASLV
jgi:hypothetical protein